MAIHQTIQVPVGKLSKQMCAVLRIITASQTLSDAVFRFISIQDDSVEWNAVLNLDLEPAGRAAIQIAHALWTDRIEPENKLFENALGMTPELKRACLKAIGIRWGI